jgi:methionyl-tRNA formyltransferase
VTALAALPPGVPRRLVYLGTPAMAVPPLEALVAAGFEIELVVTRIDKRRGRGGQLSPSAVKVAAQRLGLKVSHRVDDVLETGADLGVVVAFGQLIKAHVLQAMPMVNLHFSLLPRWRGAAPIERALLAGDATTGVSVMQLDEGLDDGPILAVVEVPIDAHDLVDDLRDRLVEVASRQLVEVLRGGLGVPQPQSGDVTYASKLNPEEFRIDWTLAADEIDRLVRVGRAWTTFRDKRLKVLATKLGQGSGTAGSFIEPTLVACGAGALKLVRVQPEGKPMMNADAWANGARPTGRDHFGARASQ